MEIFQEYGNDLVVNTVTGDLISVDGVELTRQRIIRRLLTSPIIVTNPPDYLENPTYGAGVAQFVGDIGTETVINKIKGLITSQMYLEQTVSQNPPPVITITSNQSQLNCVINYKELLTNTQTVINFTIP